MREKSRLGHFARGAEIWMHQSRMVLLAAMIASIVALFLGAMVTVSYFFYSTTPHERYVLERHWNAHLRKFFGMTAGKMDFFSGRASVKVAVDEVIRLTQRSSDHSLQKLRKSSILGVATSSSALFLLILYWWGYGKSKMTDRLLRGSRIVEGSVLKKILERKNDASPYLIAGVPMRKKSESLHILLAGAQGTGKSQQFFSLMTQVRARNKRMIVYDPSGEFTQAFYRENKDILLNPLDARSPNWNVWNEIEKDHHFDNMAYGLIPDPAHADPFFAQAGRMLLKDVYLVLGREGKRTNRDLYENLAQKTLAELHVLLKSTAGATYVDPASERTGMSLKMTVQNQLEAFRFLHDEGENFSIRRWIQEDSDSWMFITARESVREAIKPILSLWIDTAIKAVLDLDPIHRERIWFCLDELPTLQKLDILKLALTNTRKYGLCMVLGVQDFSQLYEIYGQHLAKTIISSCQTKLLLRVTDGGAAKLLAESLGKAEIDEKEESLSYGLNAQRDGVNVHAKKSLRDVVLTSEILTLPDMAGYLIIPGDYPIARVQYDYVPVTKIAADFIERPSVLNDRYSENGNHEDFLATALD